MMSFPCCPGRRVTRGALSEPSPSRLGTSLEATDAAFMQLALRVGRQGTPAPNPHVGAVVVQHGAIVAIGHHERAGEAHAEALALRRAGSSARGGTLIVTLERTPPCVDAILASGVRRVVIGCADPNPHVWGGGAEALQRAGIDVRYGPWRVLVLQSPLAAVALVWRALSR
jgi:pyrimidine deaminase RibD-like protein